MTIDADSVSGIGLNLRAVTKAFADDGLTLGPIDLEIPAGEFVAVLGPSGSGKTTLLRCLAGLASIGTGSIESVRGDSEAETDRAHSDLAFVFQSPLLMPWRSVIRNVELPLELAGVDSKERRTRAEDALARVELADAIDRYPGELSGGMAMRVSLARALVTRPRLLLMDEPFGALDEMTRMLLDERLHALWLRERPTVVFVTHSCAEATFLAERVVVLSRRPARVALDHEVDLPLPRTRTLRSERAFHEQSDVLFDALATGMEGAAPASREGAR